jgi:hypothetical protein
MRHTKLYEACKNHYGYFDVTPGTDIAQRLQHLATATINRYIASGWIKKVGTGLVLTQKGYTEA